LEIVASLQERGIQLEITEQGIDTNTIEGRLFFHIFAAVAEFEREIIKQRTMDGLSAARARGRVGGRPEKLTDKQKAQIITFYQAEQKTVQEIADLFNVSRPTIYRVLESTKVY
jgi:DNA invertase Pin-like site-specific DNA recombinase